MEPAARAIFPVWSWDDWFKRQPYGETLCRETGSNLANPGSDPGEETNTYLP